MYCCFVAVVVAVVVVVVIAVIIVIVVVVAVVDAVVVFVVVVVAEVGVAPYRCHFCLRREPSPRIDFQIQQLSSWSRFKSEAEFVKG